MVPMVNILEVAHVVSLLDSMACKRVVDKALNKAGLSRRALGNGAAFVPYASEAILLESVARSLGERHLGARIGMAFDYSAYDAYARFVLSAPDLASALERGLSALPLTHPGTEIFLQQCGDHLLLGRRSAVQSVVGNRHLDEGALFVFQFVFQHYLGADWRPEWIEIVDGDRADPSFLGDLSGTSIRTGASSPAIAVHLKDLSAPNPCPPAKPEDVVSLRELPALMGVSPPKTIADAVDHMLCVQLAQGDLSEDGVARRLRMGPRTLQRALSEEGTTFRDLRSRFVEGRARRLLSETNLSINDLARSLGYCEPNSFRRAFRAWTGTSPSLYRAEVQLNSG